MSQKIITWGPEKARQEVLRRYEYAKTSRNPLQDRWSRSERTVFSSVATQNTSGADSSLGEEYSTGVSPVDGSSADMNVGYTFKNLRFIHAQMSANPPAVVMRPASSDQDDRRKADAADRVTRYALRKYQIPEEVDKTTWNTLLYGTGILKINYDPTLGDIVEVDEETGEIVTEGDISFTIPSPWNIYLDPDATSAREVKYVVEELYIDYDEACSKWPGKQDILRTALLSEESSGSGSSHRGAQLETTKYNVVKLLEYWETGLPTNGYLGRYTITTTAGLEVEPLRPNPHRFTKFGAASRLFDREDLADEVKEKMLARIPRIARLPYHILTDIDVPNKVWGWSTVDYAANLQDNLARLDSAFLDNMEAHGVARIVMPSTAEIAEGSITNTPWDIIKYTGTIPPNIMEPARLPPEVTQLRGNIITGINDVFGVNENMFGQQSREQSAASMQYATNQGNMIRRRLFNKYVLFVEDIYRDLLDLVRTKWSTPRVVAVLGKEKALEAVDIKGMDVDGGYDVVAEYGVSLSLDPMTRREEIMSLQPLFEKAGIPMRVSLKMMKLNELEGMYDALQLADDRQREVFEEMIATGTYIAPEPMMDHPNMIAYALQYFMTVEFKYLDEDTKQLLRAHTQARGALAAQEQAGPAQPPAAAPGPVPGLPGPTPTPPAGSTGAPATVEEGGVSPAPAPV